jgi:hypothetical protein
MKLALLAATLLAIAPTGAHATAHSFSGYLTIQFGGGLPPVSAWGSGIGVFEGVGDVASIPAGVFSIQTTAPIDPPFLVLDGFAVGAPGVPTHATVPVPAGTNKALSFNGVTGTMGLDAAAYLLTGVAASPPGFVAAAIPLGIIGVGGTVMFNALGMLIMGTVFANPYQLGMVTVMGALQGVPSTLMGTGTDFRTANGVGFLQLVSPAVVNLGALGSVPVLATIWVSNPEPATALLVGVGLFALGAIRRRNR